MDFDGLRRYAAAGLGLVDAGSLASLSIVDAAAMGMWRALSRGGVRDARVMAGRLSPEQARVLDAFVAALMGADGRAIAALAREHAAAVDGIAGCCDDPARVLFVLVGSSVDKAGVCLAECGFSAISVSLSLSCGRLPGPRRIEATVRANVLLPVSRALRADPSLERVAIVDFADTGETFGLLLASLARMDPGIYARCFPVVLTWRGNPAWGVRAAAMHPGAREVAVGEDFWRLSKASRCVARVSPVGSKTGLTPEQEAVCGLVRVWVALRVSPLVTACGRPLS